MATSNLRFRIIGDDDASGAFLQVAAAAKLLNATFSDLGKNTLGLSKLIGGTGLIPVAAGATAAVTELTVSLGAAAGAAGIFGLSVVGIGVDMAKQQKAITDLGKKLATLDKGTKEYHDTLVKLHEQQKAFRQDFGPAAKGLDDLKASFSRFKDATRDVTVSVMGKAFELLADVLPRLAPIANAAGVAIGGLIDDLSRWSESSQFAHLLDWFETSGPKAITSWGHIIGNTLSGLGGILSNFVGPGDHMAHTLERLTDNFDKWGHSKGVSDSVNHFLKYVGDNGPEISAALSAFADAAPKIAEAMGKVGSLNLTVMSKFLQLIAGLPQGQFNAIAMGLFAIAAGSKAIAAVSGLKALGTGVAGLLGAGGRTGGGGGILGGVQKVWVTNPGFGTGGGAGGPGGVAGRVAKYAGPGTILGAGIGIAGVAAVASLTAFGAWKAWQAENNNDIKVRAGGFDSGADARKFNADRMAQMYGKAAPVIKAVATRLDAVNAKLGKSSRAMDLVGHSADRAFNGNAAKGIQNTSARLQRLNGVKATQAFDLIGHSASKNSADAGSSIDVLTGKIKNIPGKNVQIKADISTAMANLSRIQYQVDALHGKTIIVRTSFGHVPGEPTSASGSGASGSGSGGSGADGRSGSYRQQVSAGIRLISGLVDGIKRGYVPLQKALAKVTDYIKKQRDRMKALTANRDGFASGFQGFAQSIFGGDYGTDANGNANTPDLAGILAFQQKQADQAATVRDNVRKLVKLGLSPALLKQLQAQGPAGFAQIATLATASTDQIATLNAAQHATSASLQQAGMSAGNAIWGKQIVQTHNNIDLAKRIARELRHDDKHGKDEYVVVTVDGNQIIKAIRKNQRHRTGQASTN